MISCVCYLCRFSLSHLLMQLHAIARLTHAPIFSDYLWFSSAHFAAIFASIVNLGALPAYVCMTLSFNKIHLIMISIPDRRTFHIVFGIQYLLDQDLFVLVFLDTKLSA